MIKKTNQIIKTQNNMLRFKTATIGFIVIGFLFSCSNKTDEKIQKLENENKKLKAIIEKSMHEKIMNTQLLLLPDNVNFKLNEKNRVSIVLSEIQEYPNFELYYADNDFNYNVNNKIQIVSKEKNKIAFDFIPKSKNDNIINLVATIKSDSGKLNLYGTLELPIE